MPIKIDQAKLSRVNPANAPFVAPFSAHHMHQTKSRSILIDAAACFFATALGSLSPLALGLFDIGSTKPVVMQVDPQSGKFTDRILIGGLQPITWEEDAKVAPAPAFTTAPALPAGVETAAPPAKIALASGKTAREPVSRRNERAPEAKSAETAMAPTAPSEPASDPKSERTEERSVLAALTPSALSAKVSEKAWAGVRSVSGVVTGGLSWLGY